MVRFPRIGAIALGLALLFRLSQRASEVRGNEDVPGLLWAIGVLSLFFLVRAIVFERTRGAEDDLQKDLLWGLFGGCVITILARL